MLDARASYVRIFQNESPDSSGIDLSQYGGTWGTLGSSLLGAHMKPAVSFATTTGAGAPALAGVAITGANGQGCTKEEALESLSEAIKFLLEDRREDALRGLATDAVCETVTVK